MADKRGGDIKYRSDPAKQEVVTFSFVHSFK